MTQKQQLAIDINIRPIAKTLQAKQKYFVDSHYFLAVDNNAQPSKVRVGCKVYGFRGNAQLSNFIDGLVMNPLRLQLDAVQR